MSTDVQVESVGFDIVMNFNLQVEVFDVEVHRPETFSRIECFTCDNDLMFAKLDPCLLVRCVMADKHAVGPASLS